MSNYTHGREAEQAVAEYLQSKGYKILDQNWRTRYCEIDIVAQKKKHMIFVEVKYRRNAEHGSGLEYITPKKLKQMAFSAEMWVSQKQWKHDYSLGAAEVTGLNYEVTAFLTDISVH